MITSRKTVVIAALCLVICANSLAVRSGRGGPQGGHGDHGNHGHHGVTTTSLTVGMIGCSDPRILDISGDSNFAGDTQNLSLHITQSADGSLIGTGVLTFSDSTTTDVALQGHLFIAPDQTLWLALDSCLPNDPEDNPGDEHGHSGPNLSHDDHNTTGGDDGDHPPITTNSLCVSVIGQFDGDSFASTVGILNQGTSSSIEGIIAPVAKARGFLISDGQAYLAGNSLSSTRTVTLPSRSLTAGTKQETDGAQTLSFSAHGNGFDYNVGGTILGDVLTITQQTADLGYGTLVIPASATVISPSAFTPIVKP